MTDSVLPDRPGRLRHRRWVIGTILVVTVAAMTLALTDPFAGSGGPTSGVSDNTEPTALQTVTKQDLTSETQVTATLGYAGNFIVVDQAQGTFTSLPTVGQVISQGQMLYEVNSQPVVLLYGATPPYRNISEGDTGADIEELNADLVALGEYSGGERAPTSDTFGAATEYGVDKLQAALGVTETGSVALGQVVFLPTAVRITSTTATLGAPAQAGQSVISATSTTRQVSIALDADQQSEVSVGDQVTVTLPNNEATSGVISSVGSVAVPASSDGSSGSPTITVLVNLIDPAAAGSGDQMAVEVSITTGSVSDALVVPVDALLALSDGGYGIEVAEAHGVHQLVPVSLGLFDDADGLVQVKGKGVSVGQRVVVPAL